RHGQICIPSSIMNNLLPVKRQLMFKNVGRNDPCPCGSGLKYKKCCMSKRRLGFEAKVIKSGKINIAPPVPPPPVSGEGEKFIMTSRDFRVQNGSQQGSTPSSPPSS